MHKNYIILLYKNIQNLKRYVINFSYEIKIQIIEFGDHVLYK